MSDPVFSKFVETADAIRTSGRWASVNLAIERLAKNPGPDNEWYVQVVGGLVFSVFSEYSSLRNAYADRVDRGSSLLAWRARNLLELCVWSLYSAKSRQNARRLYEDAGRDVLQVFNTFSNWGVATVQADDWIERLTDAKERLNERAVQEGIDSLTGGYKQVAEAAVECGLGDHFRVSNKMLSKFAHPTAMQIIAAPDERRVALQRDVFYGKGCLYFAGAFEALEGLLV